MKEEYYNDETKKLKRQTILCHSILSKTTKAKKQKKKMQSIWDLVPGQSDHHQSPMEVISTNKAGRTERFVVPPLARLKTQLIPGTLIIDPSDNNSSIATTFTNASGGTPQSNCAISPPASARPAQPCQYFIADLPLSSQLGSPDPTPFALKGGCNLHVSRWFTKDRLMIEIVNAKSRRLRRDTRDQAIGT